MTDHRPDGDVATVASGDGDTDLTTVFETPDDSMFEATDLVIDYTGGTTETVLEIHDAPDTAAAGDLDADTRRAKITLSGSGERASLSDVTFRPFEEDVIADPDGNQDHDVVVTVGGQIDDGVPDPRA